MQNVFHLNWSILFVFSWKSSRWSGASSRPRRRRSPPFTKWGYLPHSFLVFLASTQEVQEIYRRDRLGQGKSSLSLLTLCNCFAIFYFGNSDSSNNCDAGRSFGKMLILFNNIYLPICPLGFYIQKSNKEHKYNTVAVSSLRLQEGRISYLLCNNP